MRILMLGWEFPPFIAGGLGTACYGLTRALSKLGHEVFFVLPKPVDRSHSSHITLLSPDSAAGSRAGAALGGADAGASQSGGGRAGDVSAGETGGGGADQLAADFAALAATAGEAYGPAGPAGASELSVEFRTGRSAARVVERVVEGGWYDAAGGFHEGLPPEDALPAPGAAVTMGSGYEGDMVGNSQRYARIALALAVGHEFDVIHAHDWMTYPAGMAVARATGKPLVAHVHSTEYDRSGEGVEPRVREIERRGMQAALRVVAVSMLTKSICVRRYGIDESKIDVVWNGVEAKDAQPEMLEGIRSSDRIVLFLGRITMQKGPEYFIAAAKRVLERVPDVKFVVAGSGDMAVRMIEYAAQLGIGHKVLFTGFLRGKQVDRIFKMADCYVMPSVSEPFGIAPLEAMQHDVPVIISKQSGVSEVLTHALKVDFWDIDQMADKIIAVLRHPPLGATLREHGAFELRKLTWEGAAQKCVESYGRALEAQREFVVH